MCKIKYILLLVLLIQSISTEKIPGCDYFDTVSLKGSERLNNGSYLYKDILIPNDKIGIYDYRTTVYGDVKQVSTYPRGCLCQVRSCILFCCEPDKSIANYGVNLTLDNGQEEQVKIGNEFAMQVKFEMSCDLLEDNNFEKETLGKWKLFENGTLLNLTDSKILKKKDYCLIPLRVFNDYYELVPQSFVLDVHTNTTLDILTAIKVVSTLFLLFTIVVYVYLPRFKSSHSKCCLYYFICVTIDILLLWIESLVRYPRISVWGCLTISFCGYYAEMSVFLWLLVINFNLWKSFKNFDFTMNTKMIGYHIFVWSFSALCLVISGLAEYLLKDMEYDEEFSWKPGFDLFYCWINTENWSAMVYFNGPKLIIILINITLSILTARHIYLEKRNNSRILNGANMPKNLRQQSDVALFLRLFAITGVIWLLDIIAYLLAIKHFKITFIFDTITSAQGIILFFATMWNRDVIRALHERLETRDNDLNQLDNATLHPIAGLSNNPNLANS